jgi:enoyl-CoA hydratase/carnithine racemase
MTSEDEILFTRSDEIGWITFNRPRARNALTFGMYRRLAEICAEPPEGLSALVLSGAGVEAFAAGTDISQFRDFTTPQHATDYEATMDSVLGAVETCPLPTIAAISGACTGGGAAIASACDLRIATSDMKFGFPIARTLGNCLLGAEEAFQVGLVCEVLESYDALMAQAREMGERLAGQAPLTLRATKEIQRRLARVEVEDEDWIVRCYTSDDFREGLDAFLSKRKPQWKGR